MKSFLKRLWFETNGQDLIEYAMMAGFVAFAAGAVMPSVVAGFRHLYKSLRQVMLASAHTDTLSGEVPTALVQTTQQASSSDIAIIRIVCAVVAITLLGIIVLRRKKNAED